MSQGETERLGELRVQALEQLVAAVDQVGRVSGRDLGREFRLWVSRGRWGRRQGWPVVPQLATPWQDTISGERLGWRTRAANLRSPDGVDLADGDFAFAVDYQVCRRCRWGWVEQPYTVPECQRHGLARAGMAALRAEHPGFAWHTLGDHIDGSAAFWDAIGVGVPGGYRQRDVCAHISAGG